jgi:hypothetical protein
LLLTLVAALRPSVAAAAIAQRGAATTGTTTGTSLTINKPTGVVAGDVMIVNIAQIGNNTTAPSLSGWTLIAGADLLGVTLRYGAVLYKVAGASEPTSYTFTLGAGVTDAVGAIVAFSGVDTTGGSGVGGVGSGPFDATTGAIDVSDSATVTATTITTADANAAVIMFGMAANSAPTWSGWTTTSPGALTEIADFQSTSDSVGAAWATKAAAGATGAGTATLSVTTRNGGILIALKPLVSTPTPTMTPTATPTVTATATPTSTPTATPQPLLCAPTVTPGTATVSGTGNILNTYYPGTATASAGATSISVGTSQGSATAIGTGDLLLVIQMQDSTINSTNTSSYGDGSTGSGATSYATAGQYEYVIATGAVSGGAVPIHGNGASNGLIYSYPYAAYTTTHGQQQFQVVRVPQYYNLTVTGQITASAWNGSSGGIVALDVASTLTFSGGSIIVDTLGFRGGGGRGLTGGTQGTGTDYRNLATYNFHGQKGEGVAGSPFYMYNGTSTLATIGTGVEGYPNGSMARGAPGNAGGGGTDPDPTANDQNTGGGGGGNGGAGGGGGNSWTSDLAEGGLGGAAFPYAANKLAMGGGGGAGTRNNSSGVNSSGGLGGGIVMIRANSITGAGTLSANGGWPATDNYTPANDGGGGGGAGGSVLVSALSGGLTSLTITATGGVGANAWPADAPGGTPGNRHGPGGGGAGGVVCLSSSAGSTTVTGGANGTTTTALDPYGATSGSPGATCTVVASQIPGASSGATCNATLASVSDFGATVEGGRVVLRWVTGSEIGTVGFHVERWNPILGVFERITPSMLPALITSPQGGTYEYADPGARPEESATYRLIEVEAWGTRRVHGPYTVTPSAAAPARVATAALRVGESSFGGKGHDDPRHGYRAIPHALRAKTTRMRQSVQGAATSGASAVNVLAATSSGAAQVKVRQDGLVSVSASSLAGVFNVSEATVGNWIAQGKIKLSNAGKPVAWTAAAGNVGILFYGQAIDSLYTLDNVYRVKPVAGTKMRKSMGTPSASQPAGVFTETLKFEQDNFAATVVATDPESDYWFWEGFIGDTLGWSSNTFTLEVPDVMGGGSLAIGFSGAAATDHPVEVLLNGELLGDGDWSGLGAYVLSLPVDGSILQSGANSVEVQALGTSDNMFYLQSFDLTYQRQTRAVGDSLTVQAANKGPVVVDGFSVSAISVFDITNPQLPLYLSGTKIVGTGADYSVTFQAKKGGRYLAVAATAIQAGTAQAESGTNLTGQDRVDYAVITTPALAGAAQALASYRATTLLKSRVVLVDDIYTNFNFGIANPHALGSFLQQAARNWGLRYAVLAGVGTFDYRDLMGLIGEEQVPTLMTATPYGLYACDGCLADFNGDGVPEVVVSRIPAGTAADLQGYVTKLKTYEQGEMSLGAAGVLMLADVADPSAGDFPADSDQVTALLPPAVAVEKVYLSDYELATARTLLFGRLAGNLGWMNYIGHGGLDRMSAGGLMTTADVADLQSTGMLPVVSALTCAVNRFEYPGVTSLGEELVLQPGGGAIAVWAATGLSLDSPAVQLDESLFKLVFQSQEPVLGNAIQRSLKESSGNPLFMRRIYNLLGDGALLLRH